MAKKTVKDIDLKNKRVLVRVDFNVPLEQRDGEYVAGDVTRLAGAIPTIQYLIDQGAKVILCSHLGRPKGEKKAKYSLAPVAKKFAELIKRPVDFIDDCIGERVQAKVRDLQSGEILLLENLRFYAEEEKNDADFAKKLASLADVYVNDAFGTAHRAHASTEGVTHFVKDSVAGFLIEKELQFLGDELNNPKKPFLVIIGGAKVSDKIKVIEALLEKATTVLIGGGMAYTFKLALGETVGKSLCEPDMVPTAKAVLEKAKAKGVKFLLPIDVMIVEKFDFESKTISEPRFTQPGENIPDGWEGISIGPDTVKIFETEIAQAKTIFWNGPVGVFEIDASAQATYFIARSIAANVNCKSIVGGGDSVAAVNRSGVSNAITFISTGGGASLEFIEGKKLPGVEALNEK
jgi:phosphoglycerate kinase